MLRGETMPSPVATETRTLQLLARTAAVAGHHHDSGNPDKPLFLLIPGGTVALASLIFGAYRVYFGLLDEHALKPVPPEVINQIILALIVYFSGLFVFSYGYELYDLKKAAKVTILAGIIGIAAVAVAVVCVYALGALAKKSGSKSVSGGGAKLGGVLGRTALRSTNIALNNMNISVNAGAILPSLPSTRPGCCSKCDQPLDPARALPEGAYLDENMYCPKCRQPYEAVGLKTVDRRPAPPPPPAPPIVPQAASFSALGQATCLACGAYLPVGADGVCAGCFQKLSRAAGA